MRVEGSEEMVCGRDEETGELGRGEGNDGEGSEEMVVWGAVRKQETGREREGEKRQKRKERKG